jgi:hypothetical protein
MKKILCLTASLLALNLTPVFGQPNGMPPSTPNFQQRLISLRHQANGTEAPVLTKFNLDFPGGTPKELVAAIEKAMSKPLNVIIPDEATSTKLPPIKASDLDVGKLFKTLSENSVQHSGPNDEVVKSFGFRTLDEEPSDSSLWTFYSYVKPLMQTQFDIDFPGGTPKALVAAIEKAMGKPLNVIINKEDENVELPPLKMNDVYVPQLFAALEAASQKVVAVSTYLGNYSQYPTSYGFKSAGNNNSDTSIWYFHAEIPSLPPMVATEKACKFYSLATYLDRGFTVDDITTAIQTGWKMAGNTPTPELNYHKETKMLIAYGEPDKLKTISDVLQTLPQTQYSLPGMVSQIKQLQTQVDQLTKKVSPPLPTATMEIK